MRIKTRQFLTYLAVIVCFVLFVSMYMMVNNIDEDVPDLKDDSDKILLVKFKESILKLKEQLDGNEAKIEELKTLLARLNSGEAAHNFSSNGKGEIEKSSQHERESSLSKLPKVECPLTDVRRSDAVIKMSDMFEKLPFDNPDGGVWKQGYDISYSDSQWNKTNKLRVFVIPHSHNDPGWIKTYEQYYQDQVSRILDNMILKLEQFPKMRFIYAEMSFFSMWWKTLNESKRNRVIKLLKDRRLELVTGGWVMADEANSHYFALLDQMIEGNQWMYKELGYKPRSGWSIDPFGHSPTMSYLLKKMPLENMLIQRTHYSVKKELSKTQQLEFFWRQAWDDKGSTDMFCHMMPFYSYDVPHTCGPDPKICCQFDFRRNFGKYSCPWKIQPSIISDLNLIERSKTLLDQYRKKSMLYRNNVVLIPLGDDFRYDTVEEWSLQYENYIKLFDYMNSRKDWNVEAKFATLSEYFEALKVRATAPGRDFDALSLRGKYPTLSGDFFVYADRDNHYWSGYFTSRPFYKKLDRELEHHQRLAEILLTMALAESKKLGSKELSNSELTSKVVRARRYLGLFQHHDGITGTAKDHVVNDYGQKMLASIKALKQVILTSSQYLLLKSKNSFKYTGDTIFELDESRQNHFDVPTQNVVDISLGERTVYFYNSLPQTRITVVTFPVTSAHVMVKDAEGKIEVSQIDPVWEVNHALSTNNFKLSFRVKVPPLGFSHYVVSSVSPGANPSNHLSKVKVFNGKIQESSLGPFQLDPSDDGNHDATFMENSDVKIIISKETGLAQKYVDKKQGDEQKMEISFVRYGAIRGGDTSGAYLFLPDGPATNLDSSNPYLRITSGPLFSEATTQLPLVIHTIRLANPLSGVIGSALDVLNMVDIRGEYNTELSMRINTDISDLDGYFYTDLNGYQVIRRKFYLKLPLQAHFYPMTSMAYLENNFKRFTLLSAQSLGAASLQPGSLEVMQDRRLNQDDNRGLEQGVLDNKRTPNRFRILLENKHYPNNVDDTIGFFTMKSHYASMDLLYPIFRLVVNIWGDMPKKFRADGGSLSNLEPSYTPLKAPMSCDHHLVNLRVMVEKGGENVDSNALFSPSNTSAMILHRVALDCGFVMEDLGVNCTSQQTTIENMFSSFSVKGLKEKSLNLIEEVSHDMKEIPPMELRAYSFELL